MADMQGIAAAVRAYSDAQRGRQLGGATEEGGPSAVGGATSGFADMVKDALGQAVQNGETSETRSLAAITDRADLNQVVTSVAEAELTLDTVVAVRDRVIEAYREILRMPI